MKPGDLIMPKSGLFDDFTRQEVKYIPLIIDFEENGSKHTEAISGWDETYGPLYSTGTAIQMVKQFDEMTGGWSGLNGTGKKAKKQNELAMHVLKHCKLVKAMVNGKVSYVQYWDGEEML